MSQVRETTEKEMDVKVEGQTAVVLRLVARNSANEPFNCAFGGD